MNPGLAGALAASIAVPLSFKLFAKFFPTKEKLLPEHQSLDVLKKIYNKWELLFNLTFLLLTALLAYLIWYPLKLLADWYAKHFLPASEVTFTFSPLYWLLPSMFLGMACATPVIFYLASYTLKERYAEFTTYQFLKYKFDYVKVGKIIFAFIIAGCIALIVFGLNDYVLLKDNELIVSGYFLTEKVYKISDIENIATAPRLTAPNGNMVERREYIITFKNGDKFATNSIPSDLNPETKRDFVEMLSHRSGIPLTEVAFFRKQDFP